jgi:hypothetical protein
MIVDFTWLFSKLPNNRQIILAKDWNKNSESVNIFKFLIFIMLMMLLTYDL